MEHIHQLALHIFPSAAHCCIERVTEGGSTWVYRLRRRHETFYLRILPEAENSFAPEKFIYQRLRALGVRVPEVVFFEHHNDLVRHSIMVTTEIPGVAVGYGKDRLALHDVVFQAGQELAIVHSLPVDRFGWIRRDSEQVDQLRAEYKSCAAWLQQDTEPAIAVLQHAGIVRKHEAQALVNLLQQTQARWEDQPAQLAHGDFDPTHIFHHGGTYTGMIDFGEIRGTPRWYDVGHFAVENADLLPFLLDGYAGTTPFEADDWQCIHMWSLLIAVRRAAQWLLKREGQVYPPDVAAIRRGLQMLT